VPQREGSDATDRGRAGYEKYRREFSKLIWELASPKWKFDDATFARSAAAFDNSDHVDIVVRNYRWRLGLAAGEPKTEVCQPPLRTEWPSRTIWRALARMSAQVISIVGVDR
jgi:hypothetical protein